MEFLPLKVLSQPIIAGNLQALSPIARATTHKISYRLENSISCGFRVSRNRRTIKQHGSSRIQQAMEKASSGLPRSFGRTPVVVMVQLLDLKKGVDVKVYENSSDLGKDLAAYVADLFESTIKEKGAFSVVLSGGSLKNSLGKLTVELYLGKVDWSKWQVFWADERVVPLDHPDNNYKLAYNGLLSKVSIPSDQVYAINDKLSPQALGPHYVYFKSPPL